MIFEVIDLFMHEGDVAGDVAGGDSPFQLPVLIVAIERPRRSVIFGIGDKEVAGRRIDSQTVRSLNFLHVLRV